MITFNWGYYMPNSLQKQHNNLVLLRVRSAALYVLRAIIGIAQDYWKDGDWSKPVADDMPDQDNQNLAARAPSEVWHMRQYEAESDGLWRAQPGEISERMWGDGYVTPGDEYFTDRLIRPLGINKDMSILDLSAGLGGRLRRTTDEFGVYISGLEPDPAIAARGMEMSIAAGRGKRASITVYDPMKLKVERSYDCVIARETIYRVPDKEFFIKSIADCCKAKAQVSFTDYIMNSEVRDEPAIVAWRQAEVGANPAGLVEMAEMWAKANVSLRVHDDQTDYYKKEVMAGLQRFAKFMASGVKPDEATKQAINRRITIWALRVAAIEAGMKFYRFYGLR
jgi:SAM-dependent methyltransferase